MSTVITEIPPLSEKDCFYIVERHKTEFMFPLHRHKEYELNFVEHGRGVRRVVGDSVEEFGEYELTLIAGGDLEHSEGFEQRWYIKVNVLGRLISWPCRDDVKRERD